ncbi:hypothetical protein TG4357_03364 [Thalassovita gelatinovora]|uniref:Uncharacterized protein n=1 Tax=Thalassovita gelatinovora TaxID=53501 RepID=A0A0P1FJ74_THAGE|nr:hypothetical protein [Thalassovita gelatinovora]QIZ81604.1 hypothetical protein HFZ77_14510 [Thalassovita gelatinovora]CUH68053.1 hypothetical protein TG4357_03364 [Thalassovita gelatinovora]SEQ28366.1 hypothetical protein SAMN04488043_104235 [Thalassovita gelatinovora]
MKLGYLNIPAEAVAACGGRGAAPSHGRAQLARALGFSEFYTAAPYLKPGCALPPELRPEQEPFLRILPDVPARSMPRLIAQNGEIRTFAQLPTNPLAAPVRTACDVRAQSFQGHAPLSVSWLDTDTLARHWAAHVTGCTHAARRARPDDWRVARTVIVSNDPARAEAAAKDPDSPCRAYYRSHAPAGADDASIDALIDGCVLYGTPVSVLDRLQDITEVSAAFGTLTLVDHHWPDRALARQSMTLFAGAVLPTYQAQMRHKTRKLEYA